MRLGIFAKTFPGTDPAAVLQEVAEHNLTDVQFNMSSAGLPPLPDVVPPGVISAIRSATVHHGIRIAALSGTFNMIHPDPEVREEGLRRLGGLARACDALEIPVLTLCTGTRDPDDMWRSHPDNTRPEAYKDLRVTLRRALEVTQDTGVTLAFEPEQANVIDSVAKAEHLLSDADSSRLGIILDLANLLDSDSSNPDSSNPDNLAAQRVVLERVVAKLSNRIVLAHAKDLTADAQVVALGKGMIDFTAYLKTLAHMNYSGSLIMHGMAASEVGESVAHLRRALTSAQPPGQP